MAVFFTNVDALDEIAKMWRRLRTQAVDVKLRLKYRNDATSQMRALEQAAAFVIMERNERNTRKNQITPTSARVISILAGYDEPTSAESTIEIYVDGLWQVPSKTNDHRNDGWIGWRLANGRTGVALVGEWREHLRTASV